MSVKSTIAGFFGGRQSKAVENSVLTPGDALRLREAISDYNAMQRAQGWAAEADKPKDFSLDFTRQIAREGRWMYWKNPLIHRGVNLQADYVFGQGLTVTSPDEGARKVIEAFQDDIRNQSVVTDVEALRRRDIECQIEGELFFALYTDLDFGTVDVRVYDGDTIADIYRNPEDVEEPWFYKRVFVTEVLNYTTGKVETKTITQYHPDIHYNPPAGDERPDTIGGNPVLWDAPIYHVKPGALLGMKRGICEFFSAQAWGKAYKGFLEDRLSVAKALSQFAMKFTDDGSASSKIGKAVSAVTDSILQRVKSGRNRGGDGAGDEAPHVPDAAVLGEGRDMQAVNVSGATINPDEGRRPALMVFAGFGFGEQYFGDGSKANLATAKTMERPAELKISHRQKFWTRVITTLAIYALIQAAKAPRNDFKATVVYHGSTAKITRDGKPIVVEVLFPDILEHDVVEMVNAIDKAAARLPFPKVIAKLLLAALKVPDADKLIAGADFTGLEKKPAELAPDSSDKSEKTGK